MPRLLRPSAKPQTSREEAAAQADQTASFGATAAESGVVGRFHERHAVPWQDLRTFNVIDDFNRDCIAVEIDTSITGKRLIRVFERLRQERGLLEVLRVDNGPEFLSGDFIAWADAARMTIQYIQPWEPNQNAYIKRFNRTYREEVLSLYVFRSLSEVREADLLVEKRLQRHPAS